MDLKYKIKKYQNGLKVLMIPMPKSYVVYYSTLILAGRDYEKPEEIESAHFLEHLNGQFTSKKYPRARKMAEFLDQLGVQHNAFVSSYLTGYHLYGQQKHASKLFDILSQSLTNFQIDYKVFKQEKNSILEELEEIANDNWYPIEQKTMEVLFPGHPSSRSVQSSINNVVKLTAEDVLKFRQRLYQPDRMLIIMAGDLSFEEMSKLVKKSGLASLPSNPNIDKNEAKRPDESKSDKNETRSDKDEARSDKNEVGSDKNETRSDKNETKKTDNDEDKTISLPPPPPFEWPQHDPYQPIFVKNYKTNGEDATQVKLLWRVPITDQNLDKYPLSALCHVLSNGMGSQLMVRLRTELGLIYSISCQIHLDPQNEDLSYLEITTSTQGRHLKKVVKNIMTEINRLRNTLLTPTEFQSVSNQIQMEFLDQQFEMDPENYAEQYSHGVLWGYPSRNFKYVYKNYEAVTQQDIQRVTKKYLAPDRLITIYSAKYPIKYTSKYKQGI